MSEIEDLYPPTQYVGTWLLIALGVIAAGIVIAYLVLWFTRPRYELTKQTTESAPQVDGNAITQALRHEYLGRIQEIDDAYAAGTIGPREANRRLSREVRQFVQDYSGFEAPVLGLNDLIAHGVPQPLVDALQRHYYPSIFGRTMVIDPVAGAEAGRLVVKSWH